MCIRDRAWTCAFPRSAPCALLVELASLGAYVVDGKMVDKPFVLRAQAIVAAAHAQGLLAA